MRDVVSWYGVPLVLHSDRGSNFESKVIRELSALLGIKKVKTTAYHPQCDGLVERLNQTIPTILSKHVAVNQKDWDTWLPCVLLAYKSAKQSSTGLSPFKLMYGYKARLPAHVALGLQTKNQLGCARNMLQSLRSSSSRLKRLLIFS